MNKNKKVKKNISILLVLSMMLLGIFFVTKVLTDKSDQVEPQIVNGINYGPPTEEERSAGDIQKEDLVQREDNVSDNKNNQDTASVLITDAGQYDDIIEVRSFISDHYEDGTCAVTISKGASSITKETPAYRDATTTICTNPLINRSEFETAGNWKVTVKYTSSSGVLGTSDEKTITIE